MSNAIKVRKATASAKAVSSHEPIHEKPQAGKTKYVKDVVEEVIDNWDSEKNFAPAQIHDKVLNSGYVLTSKNRAGVQFQIEEMRKAGVIKRVSRGKYVKVTSKATKTTKKTAKAKTAPKPEIKVLDNPDIEVAFSLFVDCCRKRDTTNGDYWRHLGMMCETFGRMQASLSDE